MRRLAALLAIALGTASPAAGVVPAAPKISDAVADTNRAAGRTEPLWLEVTLRIGDSGPVASGVLASHPTGLARLELRSQIGFVERHLLQGDEHRASRDGQMLASPRPFLPPVFLLQATSGAALSAALDSFGVVAETAALGRVGDADCYVLGGRRVRPAASEPERMPSLWVDLESYEVVRIDRRDGVRFEFGPTQRFEGVSAPRWIRIEAPGQPPAWLDIVRASPAHAPAAAFRVEWLTAPPDGEPPEIPAAP